MSSINRVPKDHVLIGRSSQLPVSEPTPVISISPIVLKTPDRLIDLQVKVSAPTTGTNLPIILHSHGQGRSNNLSSMNGYGPLVHFWASHGFVVIQPTHLSSRTLKFDESTPGYPMFYEERAADMSMIIDRLDELEAAVPQIKGRIDHNRVAVTGHSMGGHTTSMLCGMQVTRPEDGRVVDKRDPRIKVGVILAAPGNGGDSLSSFAWDNYIFMRHPDFANMKTKALVVVGEDDGSTYLNTRGPSWHADPYTCAPSPKTMLTLSKAGHALGGIPGYDAAEADDESPEIAAATMRLAWAYLRSALYPEDKAWSDACAVLGGLDGFGKVESK